MTFSKLSGVPGAELVTQGLADLSARHETIASLLVSIGAPRLRRVGIDVADPFPSAEHRLFLVLSQADGNAAHSHYNALVRRLVSFEHAIECGR